MNFALGTLSVLLLVVALSKRGLNISYIKTQSVQVVIIYCRRMQLGLGEISRVLRVAVRCSHISN